ncbi:50S ribosomal protein L23 [Candidatus Blochmanniella chromaiodes str. 640]|uniref:Large ribosomal subunit protein uL23 n=1 Tax=Candidatus Blochmanniella chromaiodes str. 640 TaxID=1240471 RepID=A0ABM5ND00_9ENTR|nr:50S ribosomal protein L23 [Candidatus Blochmannia chromaiodes]AGC03476.1 50S ribosomal protein L23 [Candidatus Blochmannia chromaiodes str. 640]
MIYQERLLKILRSTHISEKTSIILERHNAFSFRVAKYATKTDIKNAINMLFSVKVNTINTMIVVGKSKRKANKIGRCSNWKKAYVVLDKGQKIDFINTVE